ncbi:Toll/interleukin-1 receptor domain-containing protein [Tanacetum coccineum]
MADNRTMAQMLQAPIEGYEDAIVVPPINANNFELKQPLINLVQSNHFNGKNKTLTITSIFKQVTFKRLAHPEVPVPLRKSFCFSLFSRTVKPKKKGTHATQCITVDHMKLSFEMLMKGIANMKELRFLQLYGANYLSINFFTRIVYKNNWNLPNALRFLKWKGYPFSSLPKTFQANNLVALEMKCNRMVQLWKDGVKKVERWKVLFPVTPNLKDLHINYCNELERLHMPAECPKLVNLHLSNLDKFRTLHLGITPNLEKLQLKGTDLVELHMPAECPKLVYLGLYYNENLTTLHLGISPNLKTVSLEHYHALIKLQIPAECPKLVNLTLYDCTKVAELPEGIGRLECLKELDITGTHISRLPQSGAPVVLFVIASGRIDVLLLRRIERFLLIHGSDRPRILIKLEVCVRSLTFDNHSGVKGIDW